VVVYEIAGQNHTVYYAAFLPISRGPRLGYFVVEVKSFGDFKKRATPL